MQYEGKDILELLQTKAKNYNNFLTGIVVKEILKRQENPQKLKIVDFGSGIGFFASAIAEKTSSKVDCVEISENLYPSYKDKPNLLLHRSISEIDDCSADIIYSFNVLEHIEDDVFYIKLFAQKLKENGILILYLPAFMCLYSTMDKKIGHYRRYSKKELIEKLSDDFQIETLQYADSAGFFVTLLYKIIGNKDGEINPTALYIFDRFIFPLGRLFDRLTFLGGGKLFGKNVLCVALKNKKR